MRTSCPYPKCGKIIASKRLLKKHIARDHKGETLKKAKPGRYARRPYRKPSEIIEEIEALPQPTIVGDAGQPGSVVKRMGAVEQLRRLADGFMLRSNILRTMAAELENL